MTEDFVLFIRARLDDDERAATAATPGPWTAEPTDRAGDGTVEAAPWRVRSGESVVVVPTQGEGADGSRGGGGAARADAEHIAAHAPARVLREVEATRAALVMYEAACDVVREPTTAEAGRAAQVEQFALEAVFRHYAAVHADHPDYREYWRP